MWAWGGWETNKEIRILENHISGDVSALNYIAPTFIASNLATYPSIHVSNID